MRRARRAVAMKAFPLLVLAALVAAPAALPAASAINVPPLDMLLYLVNEPCGFTYPFTPVPTSVDSAGVHTDDKGKRHVYAEGQARETEFYNECTGVGSLKAIGFRPAGTTTWREDRCTCGYPLLP